MPGALGARASLPARALVGRSGAGLGARAPAPGQLAVVFDAGPCGPWLGRPSSGLASSPLAGRPPSWRGGRAQPVERGVTRRDRDEISADLGDRRHFVGGRPTAVCGRGRRRRFPWRRLRGRRRRLRGRRLRRRSPRLVAAGWWLPRCGRGRWRCPCSPCRARGVVVAGAGRRGRRWLPRCGRGRWRCPCRRPCRARGVVVVPRPRPQRGRHQLHAAAASQVRGCLVRRRDSVPEEVANLPGIPVRLRHVDEVVLVMRRPLLNDRIGVAL